ncbi:hypothetical protein BKA64DRAFT_771420 [Cadophora sp. MPI-SDFR-AT-0126]|nr:hypothetical protein BKA64DRAFT_771420 [Leotiomycetes sp. MPI-SDFR-AT-0126]
MSYNSSSNDSSPGQDWSDNFNSYAGSESTFFDEATWSHSPSPDSNTEEYNSSSKHTPNSSTASTCTSIFDDQNWTFYWSEDQLPAARAPIDRTPGARTCPLCQKTFTKQRDFNSHVRNAHTSHNCPTCDRQYSSAHFLQEHIDTSLDCSPAVRASSACPVCGERFENWAEKNRHHWKVHVKQDIRPNDRIGKEEAPMTEEEYQLYMHYFELDK